MCYACVDCQLLICGWDDCTHLRLPESSTLRPNVRWVIPLYSDMNVM